VIILDLPDITPNGAASTLSEQSGSPGASLVIEARGIILVASGSSIRLGGSDVSATKGANLPNGVAVVISANTPELGTIPLHQTWVFGSGADKVSISYWL
jgi:hypothetical protein